MLLTIAWQIIISTKKARQLKHPRSETGRAAQVGVTHKLFCSEESVKVALQIQHKKTYKLKENNDKLMTKLERLLHDSWHDNDSKIPFKEICTYLLRMVSLAL